MSRVNDARVREAQRAKEQQQAKAQKSAAEKQAAGEKFSKVVHQKKVEKGETHVQQKQAFAKEGQKNAANMLMARHGIAANKFAGMLQKQGEGAVKHGKQEATLRKDDVEKFTESKVEQDAKSERQEMVAGDKLAAISRDDRRGGGGGMGGSQQDGHPEGGAEGLAAQNLGGAQQNAKLEQAQGARVPQLPQAVLQELVKRVMVGVDPKGLSTFVIQFKDDVLAGSTMQITAENGKISAKFTTQDKNTGRLLKASEGALARAFAHKGMSLERLEVETR